MRVIAREREHYEVHDVPYGKVYSWRPERIACGAVHTGVSREPEERRTEHPWHEEYAEWRREKEANNLRHEYFDFVGTGDD